MARRDDRLAVMVSICREDFTAHSNWIELSLIKMGHTNVFPMVGDGVRYPSPDGQSVPPLVTGSFGRDNRVRVEIGIPPC